MLGAVLPQRRRQRPHRQGHRGGRVQAPGGAAAVSAGRQLLVCCCCPSSFAGGCACDVRGAEKTAAALLLALPLGLLQRFGEHDVSSVKAAAGFVRSSCRAAVWPHHCCGARIQRVCSCRAAACRHSSPAVLVPALRTVGNIVTGNDMQTQVRTASQLVMHPAGTC